MNASAAASSSAVLTPGRIFPCTRLSVLTRMLPAAAILSISSGVFLRITGGPSRGLFQSQSGERTPDVLAHLLLRPRPVEAVQKPAVVVVVDQRRGLLVVDLEPPPDL